CQPISHGFANENYKIITTVGNYLFRICKEQELKMIEYEIKLMHSLKQINFPTAYPIVRKDGNYISKSENKNIVIYEFKKGKEPELNKQTCHQIGKAIGQLTKIPNSREFKKKNVINLPDCLEMINNFPQTKCQYPTIFNNFENIIKQLYEALQVSLPQSVIHADLFPDNTLFDDNKLIAIIDFEEANYDNMLFDVGMTANGFCFIDNKLESQLLKILLEAYEQERKLSSLEKELLPDYIRWGAVGMAYWHLRHLINRPFAKQQSRVEELLARANYLNKEKRVKNLL
ncbi:MAG: homoserine kinase, partial [Cytophagales bacterium]|nr:homoserine kinase [Cytophagales bacterium]